MLLPQMSAPSAQTVITDTFLGYNHNIKIGSGEMYDAKNISTKYYPLLAPRGKRGFVKKLKDCGGLLAKEKLAYVEGGKLIYDGEETPLDLSEGEKKLVSMGAYICIFPDKVYYNTADPTDHGSMEATYSSTGSVKYSLCKADGSEYASPTVSDTAPENPGNGALWIDTTSVPNVLKQWSSATEEWSSIPTVYTKLSFISTGEIPALFKVYDGVHIEGAAEDEVNGDKVIYALGGGENTADYIVVAGLLEQTLENESSVRISRTVPELDHVIECNNRLWGCRYGNDGKQNLNEIYCCALGDFKNWRQYMGLSTDSWTASVGSDGAWTGAVNYLGYPMFFKEDRIHRVTVSSVGAHSTDEIPCSGVQPGSEKSLIVINNTLYYKARSGICAYQGGFPVEISKALGDVKYSGAVSGTIEDKLYISMKEDKADYSLFVYDTRTNLWSREDELHCMSFATLGEELYTLTADGRLLALCGTEGEPEAFVEWYAESGIMYWQYTNRKYISRFNVRVAMEAGAELDIYIEYDSSKRWERQGRVQQKGTGTVMVPVRPRRCDHLRIKLEGKGEIKLFSIAKVIEIGSDRK